MKERNSSLWRGIATVTGMATMASLLAPRRAEAITLSYANSIPGTGDAKVLNYAYLLQDFESQVYQAALAQLSNVLNAGSGNAVYNALAEFATVEQDQAAYLSAQISAVPATPIAPALGNTYAFTPITNATTVKSVLEFVLQVEATVTRGMLATVPLLSTASPYLQRLAAIQSVDARHATTLTMLHNSQYSTTTDVAPLPADNNLTGSFTLTSFGYEQYNTLGYNTLKPNQGVIGIEANLMPDTLLTSLIAPYMVPHA